MVWIWQALYGRHLRWHEEKRKIETRGTKSQVGIQNRFWTPFGNSKWNHFGTRITCDNDSGGSQVVKKRGPKTRIEKRFDSDPRSFKTQPREGGEEGQNLPIGRRFWAES